MRIKVLGCYGTEMFSYRTSGYLDIYKTSGLLINDSLIVDAGSITTSIDIPEQEKITHILLSHSHLDHIKGLPFLADNLWGRITRSIEIMGIKETIDSVKNNILNDSIWPDITKIPASGEPICKLVELKEGEKIRAGRHDIIPIRVNHAVPAVGYIIDDGESAIIYSGDTYKTERLWEEASRKENLKAAIIETSFPNRLSNLAILSGHLTPEILKEEFKKIGKPDIRLFVYHMKPQYLDEIKKDIGALKMNNIVILQDGKIIEI